MPVAVARIRATMQVRMKPLVDAFQGNPPTFIPIKPVTRAMTAITSPAESKYFIKWLRLLSM